MPVMRNSAARIAAGHPRECRSEGQATMRHALIIHGGMAVGRVVEARLVPLGFYSFEHSWTEAEAVAAADRRIPDLVVIGDGAGEDAADRAARRIRRERNVPILRISAEPAQPR